jgi:hypothetical protein
MKSSPKLINQLIHKHGSKLVGVGIYTKHRSLHRYRPLVYRRHTNPQL